MSRRSSLHWSVDALAGCGLDGEAAARSGSRWIRGRGVPSFCISRLSFAAAVPPTDAVSSLTQSPIPVHACRLKESGFKLCCVSNFDTRLPDILYDLGIGVYFDAFVVSGEVGYEKPSRGIFDAALEKCGARPEEVVHIGDDRRNDIWVRIRGWLDAALLLASLGAHSGLRL